MPRVPVLTRFTLATCLLLFAACSAPSTSQPGGPVITLALVNGRIWTGNASQPDAEAVAVAGDRIVAVGTTADIRARAAGSEVVDLGGQFVVPGFIDSHVHFVEGGFRLTSVQLRDARTREEFVNRIKAYAAANGIEIKGEDYTPLGSTDFSTIVNKVRASGAGAVFNTLNGDSNVAFFKEYTNAGLTPQKMPVVSVSTGAVSSGGLT